MLCLDPFHIVRWATQALDVVRRWVWNTLRRMGLGDQAKQLKNCRYALWKNPEDLTNPASEQARLDRQAQQPALPGLPAQRAAPARVPAPRPRGEAILDAWLQWARRCQIPAFVELYHRIKKHRAGIIASVTHGLSNGLTESVDTKLRFLTRIAYEFRSTDNLIALCLLDRGGHCPPPPGRERPTDPHGEPFLIKI